MQRYIVSQFDSNTFQVIDQNKQREICVCANFDARQDGEERAEQIASLLNQHGQNEDAIDLSLLRTAIALAARAREHGNHPFGALLADENGNILLEAENTVNTENDASGHAETNLVRLASKQFPVEVLAKSTLYTSTEPCPMCAGAIFWSGIGRVVYALSEDGLYALTGDSPESLKLACREVFARGGRPIEVLGPLLEEEAAKVHAGFWD